MRWTVLAVALAAALLAHVALAASSHSSSDEQQRTCSLERPPRLRRHAPCSNPVGGSKGNAGKVAACAAAAECATEVDEVCDTAGRRFRNACLMQRRACVTGTTFLPAPCPARTKTRAGGRHMGGALGNVGAGAHPPVARNDAAVRATQQQQPRRRPADFEPRPDATTKTDDWAGHGHRRCNFPCQPADPGTAVCGANGVTYPSRCALRKASCERQIAASDESVGQRIIRFKHAGPCTAADVPELPTAGATTASVPGMASGLDARGGGGGGGGGSSDHAADDGIFANVSPAQVGLALVLVAVLLIVTRAVTSVLQVRRRTRAPADGRGRTIKPD